MTIEVSPGGVGFVRTTAKKSVGSDAAVVRLHRPDWVGTPSADAGAKAPASSTRRSKKR